MIDSREEFEKHFKPTIRQQKRHINGDYRDPDIQAKWFGWQAAFAAIAVQRAEPVERRQQEFGPDVCPGCGGAPDNGFNTLTPPHAYYCSKCDD